MSAVMGYIGSSKNKYIIIKIIDNIYQVVSVTQ